MTTKTVCVPRELLENLVVIWKLESRGRPGSPNHSHEIPGVWDSDNGDLAEKPCSECAVYEAAKALLAQPVVSEPVAWQWLNTAHFRRKIPAYENACHWEPLYRHPPAPAIPEGYALVPIEPTEAMRDAGNIYSLNRATLMRIWADMLGAAQQPTEGSTDE